MTDQPTKWKLDDCGEAIYVYRGKDMVRFLGPDREANAAKFMLMDELVEAARNALDVTEGEFRSVFRERFRNARARVNTILAKIEGTP